MDYSVVNRCSCIVVDEAEKTIEGGVGVRPRAIQAQQKQQSATLNRRPRYAKLDYMALMVPSFMQFMPPTCWFDNFVLFKSLLFSVLH